MRICSRIKYWIVFTLFLMGMTSYAQDYDLDELRSGVNRIESRYSRINIEFDKNELEDDSLRASLKILILDLDSLMVISTNLDRKIDGLSNDLSDLGPMPEEGAPEEAKNVREKRAQLKRQINLLTGELIHVNDLIDAIGKLRSEISNYHTSASLSGITVRTVSPFSGTLWNNGHVEYTSFRNKFNQVSDEFWKEFWGDKKLGKLLLLLASALFVIGILLFPFSFFGKRIGSTFKLSSADIILNKRLKLIGPPLIISVLVLLALGLMLTVLTEISSISPEGVSLSRQMILWIALAVFIWNFARKLFSQDVMLWNGLKCAPGKEHGNGLLFTGMLFLFIGDTFVKRLFEALDSGTYLVSAQSIVFTSLFSILLYIFFLPKRWLFASEDERGDALKSAPDDKKSVFNEMVSFIGRIIAVLILFIIAIKHERLANFLFQRMAILTLVYIFFTSIRTITHWIIMGLTKHSQLQSARSLNSYRRRTSLDFWINTALDATLVILTIPAVLFAIGFDWIDIDNWIHMFLNGIEIGSITISFKNLFNGLFSFLLIIVAVRWTASMISKRLKEYTNLDSGVRNSIVTLLNYAGVVIALITAIPMLGFNFTNVTVVAGALSVGIGFGLQNIVKDFISGLILLIDRPVKIDDWIVVNSGQGYVKEIKSRVTIIQTFDRSKIIVPNSELVTLPMQNWFYGNRVGRVRVKVGVAYSSDPDKVREVLLSCAQEDSRILTKPKPYVLWKEFGESSLNFELRSYIANNDNAYLVRSDLHFSIYKALKEAGIVIPFPQRDLHINGPSENTEKLESMV